MKIQKITRIVVLESAGGSGGGGGKMGAYYYKEFRVSKMFVWMLDVASEKI